MQALVTHSYGSPEVLQIEELPTPTVQENEVLVAVEAAGVNAGDWHLLRGTPFPVRLVFGVRAPKHKVLGSDLAGRVLAVGSKVTRFQPGDAVFGNLAAVGFGTFAEKVAVPEEALVMKPANVSFVEAAAIPLAALTALQGLRDHGKLQAGQRVLVNGALGVGYVVDFTLFFLVPEFPVKVSEYTFVGEVLLLLWLLVKGVNVEQWNRRALEAASI
jgi:NADPH:quinone reductase-like Zn-dependent oxidoreductase